MDDFIGLDIPISRQVLDHVANRVMCGIHNVFPQEPEEADDPILLKKLLQQEGAWDIMKELLGFVFNRSDYTMWLVGRKRQALILTITLWLRASNKNKWYGIPFGEF